MPKSNFMARTHQGSISICRVSREDCKIDMVPGEVDKAKHLVGLVLSMLDMRYVPDHVKNTPFVVRIFKKQNFALERTDKSGSLPFRGNEGDELINVIQMGLDMCVNDQTHGRAVRPVNPVVTGLADNFDG